MGSRKADTAGIDEALLLASIGKRKENGSVQKTEPPEESPPARPVRKKVSGSDYGQFLQRNEIKSRKCVYISSGVHDKIQKIVNILAGDDMSIGGYIDLVLEQHLQEHKDTINELYKQQRDDLI